MLSPWCKWYTVLHYTVTILYCTILVCRNVLVTPSYSCSWHTCLDYLDRLDCDCLDCVDRATRLTRMPRLETVERPTHGILEKKKKRIRCIYVEPIYIIQYTMFAVGSAALKEWPLTVESVALLPFARPVNFLQHLPT